MMSRLASFQLARLPAEVSKPQYDRDRTGAGIVHLGVGAFHRAHQAWYTEQVLNKDGGDWLIVGASLRGSAVGDQLNPQDGLYTIVVRDSDRRNLQVIGAIREVIVGPDSPQCLVEWLAHPDIKVVTLTITEKGYYFERASDGLLESHPDIEQDIRNFPENPKTAVGYLASSLARRRDRGSGGVTLLSCDNLPHNGRVLQKVLKAFVLRTDTSLSSWIEQHVTFPCSMVDRIVPASTGEDLVALAETLGCEDQGAVFTEPFSQWVIEDNFSRGAPDWKSVGALYTDDVTPFETMKLRLLNGSHSLIAYLGHLAGYDYVHQVMADDVFNQLVRRYMDTQAQPTLQIPRGFDIENYKDQLYRRFSNAALNHRTYQIAQDGSQKIPQRWLATLRDLLAMGQPVTVLALAIAGWIRYLEGVRDSGERYAVDDPLFETLTDALAGIETPRSVFSVRPVFGNLAETSPDLVSAIADFYHHLKEAGVARTVAEFL